MANFRKWAQTRNFAKLRLMGVRATLLILSEDPILEGQERRALKKALEFVAPVVRSSNWNEFTPLSKEAYAVRAVEHERRWLADLPRVERKD